MYAIVKTGGKQYMVNEGDVLEVEKLMSSEGDTVELEVLAVSNDGDVKTGADAKNSKVTAKVLEHGRGSKIIVFKYKPKKDYRKKKGHRQPYTKIQIEKIEA